MRTLSSLIPDLEDSPEFISIESVDSFIGAWNKLNLGKTDTYQREYFFRGHANKDWKPIPGIYRNKGWIDHEDVMIKDLISKCPNEFKNHKYTFQSLVKMQHYSLPTRLLDITTNPLIALYFACLSEKDVDGEVMIFCDFKTEIKYYDSDTVSVLSNIARRPKGFNLNDAPKSDEELEAFNSTKEMQLLLHEIKHEKPHFEPKIQRGHVESVVFVRPLLDNPRIIKQDGAFILFGINEIKTRPAEIAEFFYPRQTNPRLIISANAKDYMLKELATLGISRGSIFPEIDSVAEFIRSRYQAP